MHQLPRTVSRKRPFYGWSVVFVAALAVLAGTAMGPTAFSVFIEPMSEDLGWNRTTISAGLSLGTLAGAAAAPLAGLLVDRYGARAMLSLAGLGLGVSMVGVAFSSSPLAFYLFYGLGRMLDMGVILVGSTAAVANWFIRRRGRAMGLAMMGSAAGLTVIVPLAQALIETSGWRTAWLVLAVALSLSLTPAAALIVRRRPEDLGLCPDGDDKIPDPASRPPVSVSEVNWSLGQAWRSASFWLLTTATSLGLLAFAGTSTHQIPALVERGLSPTTAAWIVSFHAIAWAAGNIAWGFASERLPSRYGLAIVYLLAALAVLLLLNSTSLPLALAYAVLYGLVVGGLETIESIVWADYYGRFSLGAIRGFSRPFLLGANALGTFLAGVAYDATGSYATILIAFAGLLSVSALLMVLTRPPGEERAEQTG